MATGPNPFSPYAEVAVPLPLFQTFTYRVPRALRPLAGPGKRVRIPFGKRRIIGYILSCADTHDGRQLKNITEVIDDTPLFPASMLPFLEWIADYYIHPLGMVIENALPAGAATRDVTVVQLTEKGLRAMENGHASEAEHRLLAQLSNGPLPYRRLKGTGQEPSLHSDMESCRQKRWIDLKKELRAGKLKPNKERFVTLVNTVSPHQRMTTARRRICKALGSRGQLPLTALRRLAPSAPRIVKALEKAGMVTTTLKTVYRDPLGNPIEPDHPPQLTPDQAMAAAAIIDHLQAGFKAFLLSGVTGSGKTEVYMQAAAESIARDLPVVVLVPEIGLISQTERRFRARFGNCIAVLHSALTARERFDQWLRVADVKAPIVIGARSAIFAPLDRIGLIIVDEEHDTSYKQERQLRYNARDLAVVRAKQQNAVVVLGTATPSIQSFHNTLRGKFTNLSLPKRIHQRPLAAVELVDLREKKALKGISRFITPELQHEMRETLEKGEQILLFLNRRGYANFPICSDCGEVIQCNNCSISLTYHQKTRILRCHYCGFSRPVATHCPQCRSPRLNLLGLGTEKVQETVEALFPGARVARMDRDTIKRKGALVKILKGLQQRTIDVLVGTQMVAKGHDFPHITLVGIICADQSLHFPDFRAGVRTFQLLAQVAGRAGRGQAAGKVLLQTYTPDHFSIVTAQKQDFEAFYDQEIIFRRTLQYPPFTRLIQLRIDGDEEGATATNAKRIGLICSQLQQRDWRFKKGLEILGPLKAAIPRLAGQYRWQIIIKSPSASQLHGFVREVLFNRIDRSISSAVGLGVDVDPMMML
jgi:primosomal protein N' (replication factor Y)